MNLNYESAETNFQVTPMSFPVSISCAVSFERSPSNLQQRYCSLATSSPQRSCFLGVSKSSLRTLTLQQESNVEVWCFWNGEFVIVIPMFKWKACDSSQSRRGIGEMRVSKRRQSSDFLQSSVARLGADDAANHSVLWASASGSSHLKLSLTLSWHCAKSTHGKLGQLSEVLEPCGFH